MSHARRIGGGVQHGPGEIRSGDLEPARDVAVERAAASAGPDTVAALILGACFQQAFLRYFSGGPDFTKAAATELVHSLLPALQP